MPDYTTTELIADIKQRCSVPTSQNLFDESKFVRFLSNKLRDNILPQIMSAREDFFVASEDIAITTTTQATNAYAIPQRAVGMKLKTVVLVDAQGNEEELPRLSYKDKSLPGYVDYQSLYGYYLEGNKVRLHLADSYVNQTLRMYFFRRPNQLVKTSEAGKITNIDTGTNVITLDNAPTSWTTSTTFDAICADPPFDSKADDLTITNIAGFDLTFATIPDELAVGDWIAVAGESPVAQIPYEAYSLLTQLGVIKVLEALKDTQGMQNAVNDYNQMRQDFFTMITPRVDGQPKKVVSRTGTWRLSGARKWGR